MSVDGAGAQAPKYGLGHLLFDIGTFAVGFVGGQKLSEAGRRGDMQDPLTHWDIFRLSRASNPNSDVFPAVLFGLAALTLKYIGADAGFFQFETPNMTSPFGGSSVAASSLRTVNEDVKLKTNRIDAANLLQAVIDGHAEPKTGDARHPPLERALRLCERSIDELNQPIGDARRLENVRKAAVAAMSAVRNAQPLQGTEFEGQAYSGSDALDEIGLRISGLLNNGTQNYKFS